MKKIFVLLISIFTLFSVGGATFLISTIGENKDCAVTIDYNDGNITENITIYKSKGEFLNNSEIDTPVFQNDNHRLLGWYLTKSGFNADGSSSLYNFSTRILKNFTLYAKYKNSSINFESTDVNLNSNNGQSIYFVNKYNPDITNGDLIISKKINIQYGNGLNYNESQGGNYTRPVTLSECDCRLVLDTDVRLNGGGIQLNSIVGYYSKESGFQQALQQEYTALDLNGYNLILENNASLNGYGLIYNSKSTGGIILKKGQLYTPYCINDFRGGTNLVYSYKNGIIPYLNYCVPYLSCEVLISSNSYLYGVTALCNGGTKYSTNLMLFGDNNALITINQGYAICRNDSYVDLVSEINMQNVDVDNFITPDFRQRVIFADDPLKYLKQITKIDFLNKVDKANIVINSLTLTLKIKAGITISVDVNMKYLDYSIPSFFDIRLYNTYLTFSNSFVFMPSSKLYCDEKSEINFSNTKLNYQIFARLSLLDEYPKESYYSVRNVSQNNGNITSTLSVGTADISNNNRIVFNCVPARIIMDGVFSFNKNNVNFSKSDSYYTLGGHIDCSSKAYNSLMNNKDLFQLNNNFYMPYYSSFSIKTGKDSFDSYSVCGPTQYYSEPLISKGVAFIQNVADHSIKVSTNYDEISKTFNMDGKTYYAKYVTDGFYSIGLMPKDMINSNPASADEQRKKLDNSKVIYDTCILKTTGEESKKYILVGGVIKVLVNGAWVSLETTENEFSSLAKIAIKNEINKMTYTNAPIQNTLETESSYILSCNSVAYNYYFNRWYFTNA